MAERNQRARPSRERRSEERSDERSGERSDEHSNEHRGGERRSRVTGPQAAGRAAEELLQLTGKDIEGIVGLERVDSGWKVQVEVLEVRRIPDTTDVLALYEVDTDQDGSLAGYRRLRRYGRGAPGQEGDGG